MRFIDVQHISTYFFFSSKNSVSIAIFVRCFRHVLLVKFYLLRSFLPSFLIPCLLDFVHLTSVRAQNLASHFSLSHFDPSYITQNLSLVKDTLAHLTSTYQHFGPRHFGSRTFIPKMLSYLEQRSSPKFFLKISLDQSFIGQSEICLKRNGPK